jgi:hypothetical protein
MREVQNPPDAASLLESMRSIGYTLDSALADLIDNSLSAKAKKIEIQFRAYDDPYIALIDDGIGMSLGVLENAMRHGSTNPLTVRGADDMGRYGLGMKTSSLSQCRRMTVISKQNGVVNAFCWDLDVVITKSAWIMLELDDTDLAGIPHYDQLVSQVSGTIVLWQNLDKLMAGESSADSAFADKMTYAREHLALVFHRFLAPDIIKTRVIIKMNDVALTAIDPFWSAHKSTQVLDEDSFSIGRQRVIVKPFIIPHISKMNSTEVKVSGGSEGVKTQQGFYIYRNKRLIIWGTWFRLARKDELSKLARVRVDIPNSLDHLWTLDVKKSAAHPPEAVRVNLRRIVERIRGASGRTITFKGRKVGSSKVVPGWQEVIDRDGVRYDVNREHPLIVEHIRSLSKEAACSFNLLIGIIESTFPAEALYSQMAGDLPSDFNNNEAARKIKVLITEVLSNMPSDSAIRRQLLSTLHLVEPFNSHPEITRKIIKEYEV